MSDCLAFRFFSNSIFLSRIFGCSAVKVCVFASPHFLLCFTQWFDSRLTKTHADYVDGASKMCITYHELRGKRKVATRHAVHVTAVFPTDRKIALVFRRFVLSNRFTQNPNGNRRNTKIYAIHFVTFHTWNKFDSSVNSVCVCATHFECVCLWQMEQTKIWFLWPSIFPFPDTVLAAALQRMLLLCAIYLFCFLLAHEYFFVFTCSRYCTTVRLAQDETYWQTNVMCAVVVWVYVIGCECIWRLSPVCSMFV